MEAFIDDCRPRPISWNVTILAGVSHISTLVPEPTMYQICQTRIIDHAQTFLYLSQISRDVKLDHDLRARLRICYWSKARRLCSWLFDGR